MKTRAISIEEAMGYTQKCSEQIQKFKKIQRISKKSSFVPIAKKTRSTSGGLCAIPTYSKNFYKSTFNKNNKNFYKEKVLNDLPTYKRFSDIYIRACKIVHGIFDLYEDIERGQIHIYFGRSQESAFINNCRYKHKDGYHGVVPICFAPIEDDMYKRCEKLAIAILQLQKENNALCVGGYLNKKVHSGGPLAKEKPILYLAWKIVSHEALIGKIDIAKKKLIYNVVKEKYCDDIPHRSVIMRALSQTTRVSEKINLYWPSRNWGGIFLD